MTRAEWWRGGAIVFPQSCGNCRSMQRISRALPAQALRGCTYDGPA